MTSCHQQEMSQLSKVDELLNKGQFEHADMLLRKAEKESLNSEALRAYFSFLFYLVFWNDLISEEASRKNDLIFMENSSKDSGEASSKG